MGLKGGRRVIPGHCTLFSRSRGRAWPVPRPFFRVERDSGLRRVDWHGGRGRPEALVGTFF